MSEEASRQSAHAEALQRAMTSSFSELWHGAALQRRLDMLVEAYWAGKRERSRNPLLKCGEKFFSQNDEDGILLEICRRLKLDRGTFIEIGVGNGLENNSLILLMHGWNGVWLGGQPLAFDIPADGPLRFQHAWIDRDNCVPLVSHGLDALGGKPANLLSIDVDGNDLYLLEKLLQARIRPDILMVEYNAKFPPPVRWSIAYDPSHAWDGSDYQGASLQSLADVAASYDYRPVACNLTGANVFFVANRHASAFADVPADLGELFMPADYNWFAARGHAPSPRTVARFLEPRER